MKQDISSLMDGELGGDESARVIRACCSSEASNTERVRTGCSQPHPLRAATVQRTSLRSCARATCDPALSVTAS